MRRIIQIFIGLLYTATISAQTLEECQILAREHYPEIRQYDLVSQTEQYNLSNASRAWIPQIALSGQATWQSATPTYPDVLSGILKANGVDMAGIRKDQYKVAIDLTQNIWDGGKSKADKAIAKADANEEQSRLNVSLYELQSRIENIYFGILLLDERTAQTEALIKVLESNLARMRSYCNNGTATQADVDAIEAEMLSAKQTLGQIEASRSSYRKMLEIFIGTSLKDEKLSRPALPIIGSRTSARPELELFNAQEKKIDAQRKAINSSVMPKFYAFAQGFYGYPGMDMFKSMVDGDWSLNAMVGIKMAWNINGFYTKKNNLHKLNIAQQQVGVQRDIFLFNSEIQTTKDDGEITRLIKAINDDSRIVELRRNVRIAAESKFKNGVFDVTDLLQKITDETNSQQNKSTHEIELLQASYRLKHTLNQ
ncbi:MAG: TolC family protein [Bacteroidales bacterium]|nr:TolC family protein [Bacteroidales bacterium]